MNGDADGGRRAVAGDLGDGLRAEGTEVVVDVDQHGLEILGRFADHRRAVIRQIRVDALAVLVQLHILIEGVTDGLHRGAVHLAQRDLGIDGRARVLQGVELLHLDLAGPDVDRDLREVRAVGHGGCGGDVAAVRDHLPAAVARDRRVGQLAVGERLAARLGIDLAGCANVQILDLFVHLQSGLCQDLLLELFRRQQ